MSDRNPEHLYASFRTKLKAVINDMAVYAQKHMPGYEWTLVEGFRTAGYQNQLFQKGRTIKPIGPEHIVTNCDGYKRRSKHQSSLAADFVPFKGGQPDWKVDLEHWGYLGHIAHVHGLEWGGDWQKLKDLPHIQWPQSDAATYQAAAKWIRSGFPPS